MITSGIGAFIIAIASLVLSISLLITGTSIGLYRQALNKKKITLERNEIKEDKNADLKETQLSEDVKVELKPENDPFPFDDPYK